MNIKMIVTDLDRTLLRTDKTISSYTAEILNLCRERGIKIIFATARPMRTVKHFGVNVTTDALILHNGAVIYAADERLCYYGIAPDIRDKILSSISKDYPTATISVEIDDVLYANFDIAEWGNTKAVRTTFDICIDLPDKYAEKIIIGVPSLENAGLLRALTVEDMECFSKYITDDLYIEISDGKFALIMHRNATKGAAVKAVADHIGIAMGGIAAFGDDYNDVSMLRECGVGVAVANALDEVKAAADYICDVNNNDGVAKWIEERILI